MYICTVSLLIFIIITLVVIFGTISNLLTHEYQTHCLYSVSVSVLQKEKNCSMCYSRLSYFVLQ